MTRALFTALVGLTGLFAASASASGEQPITCAAFWEGWYYTEVAGCQYGSASGCSNPFPFKTEEACRAANPGDGQAEPEPIATACDPSLPVDPYRVNDVRIEGDTLLMSVEYGGGCKEHLFTMCWDDTFLESQPVQADLALHHDAQDDLCRAIVFKDLAFDLSSIKKSYRKAFRQRSGVILLRIPGYEPLVRYSF